MIINNSIKGNSHIYRKYWSPQEEENSCGLSALKIAAQVLGVKTEEKEIRSNLGKKGFYLHEFGVFSSYIGIGAIDLNLLVEIHTPNLILRKILKKLGSLKRIPEVVIECTDPIAQTFIDSYIFFWENGGRLIIYSGNKRPSLKGIIETLDPEKSVAIVRICSSDYYQISGEKWGHYLTLALNEKGTFTTLDCYKKKGALDYKKQWIKYLKNAENYNWDNWGDDLIVISKR